MRNARVSISDIYAAVGITPCQIKRARAWVRLRPVVVTCADGVTRTFMRPAP